MPAIFFRYELSPIRIQYTVFLQSFSSFLVRICAIVGGIYTVSSIFESLLRNGITIFSIGAPEEKHNPGARGSTMRRVKKAAPSQPPAEQYTNVVTEDSSIELSSAK